MDGVMTWRIHEKDKGLDVYMNSSLHLAMAYRFTLATPTCSQLYIVLYQAVFFATSLFLTCDTLAAKWH